MDITPDPVPDNVVAIRPDIEIQFHPKRVEWCKERCKQVWVVEKTRQLECRHCGRIIEAFDYVLSIANGETQLATTEKDLRQQIADKRKELERLEHLVRNTRAKARRAGVPSDDVLVTRDPWTNKSTSTPPL